jgi:phosphoserine phosphatase
MTQVASISADQMKRVLDISRALTITSDLDLLLRQIAEAACDLLRCERASIWLFDGRNDELWTTVALQSQQIRVPSGAGIVGSVFKTNRLLHVPDPYNDARFNPEPDRRSGFITRNLLTAPMPDLDGRPVGVIQAVNKKDAAFDLTDSTMIELLADQAGVAIQRYNLQQAAVQAMAMRREMELAKAVQQALLPGSAPHIPGIESSGWSRTASIAGGDTFDLWKTSDGRLGIFLGDATGHGIGPAMVISQTRTLIRAMCDVRCEAAALLATANTRLAEDLDAGHFVTAFVAFLSPDGDLDWCSAGHGPIFLRTGAGKPLQALDSSAPPLGVVPEFVADELPPTVLEPGGAVCVTSDGISEAFNPAGDQFGVERVAALITDCIDGPLDDLNRRLQQEVRAWEGKDDPRDDQTLVIAVRR